VLSVFLLFHAAAASPDVQGEYVRQAAYRVHNRDRYTLGVVRAFFLAAQHKDSTLLIPKTTTAHNPEPAEHKDSTLLIPKTTTAHNPEPIPSTSHPHNVFPLDPSY
jgi:hypothetical protein